MAIIYLAENKENISPLTKVRALASIPVGGSYRIIDFESITCQQGKAVLTKSDIENIEKELRNKGVQFMRGESQEIKIRLNEDGQKLYNRILHLRPKYIRIEEENIYVFDCSLKQIEYYFLSLVKRLKLSHHLN